MIWAKTDHAGPIWISGIYKISRYDQDLPNHLGVHYRAYYIRKPDKYWGYHVDPSQPYFLTLKAAQAACETHWRDEHATTSL